MAASIVGWEAVKKQFDLYDDMPYYALFEGKGSSDKAGRLIYPFKGDNKAMGWDLLQENLQASEQNTPEACYIIQFYDELPKSGKLDVSTPYSGSFKFALKGYEAYKGGAAIAGTLPASNDFNAFLRFELDSSRARVRELEQENRQLEDQIADLEDMKEEPAIEGALGQIGAAGNQFPWLAEILKDWSTVLKHKFTGPGGGGSFRPAGAGGGLAGVATDAPPDQKINAALKTLVSWYTLQYGGAGTKEEQHERGFQKFAEDLTLLANLTADTDMLHIVLKKLRAAA